MNTSISTGGVAPSCLAFTLTLLTAMPASAVERVSVSTQSAQGNSQSRHPVVSADGRYVAFDSDASTLVAGDTNAATDVFVRDRLNSTTTRVSVTPGGAQVAAGSNLPSISGNGQRITFVSNGVLLPESRLSGCYLLDRTAGTLDILDREFGTGTPAPETCYPPSISVDGNRIAFASSAVRLLPEGMDTNNRADVFVRNIAAGSTVRVNLGPGGAQANLDSDAVRISAFGSHVVYGSTASNLVAGDTNDVRDIFMSDLAGNTQRLSVGAGQQQANGASFAGGAANGNGTITAFSANASSLPAWGEFVESILYLRLPGSDLTVPLSIPVEGTHEGWAEDPDFSATGRWLVFWASDELIAGVPLGGIFVVDLLTDTIALVSRQPNGEPAGAGGHYLPRISADGRGIVWYSNSALLVPNDTNGTWDVFYADNPLWDDTLFADGFEP